MVKSFRLTFDYVLYEMSYQNVVLYNAVLPNYNANKRDKANNETKESKMTVGEMFSVLKTSQ